MIDDRPLSDPSLQADCDKENEHQDDWVEDDDDLVLVTPPRNQCDTATRPAGQTTPDHATDSSDLDSMLQRLDALSGMLDRHGNQPAAADPAARIAVRDSNPTTAPQPRQTARHAPATDIVGSLRRTTDNARDSATLAAGARRLSLGLLIAILSVTVSTLLLLLADSTRSWTYFGGLLASAISAYFTFRFVNDGRRIVSASETSYRE